MTKVYQVRYPQGDETVAHEHETEAGAKKEAKALSKAHGSAMIGEIEIKEDGTREIIRSWEWNGGKAEKPVLRTGTPSEVPVVKTVEETKLPEIEVKAKEKSNLTPLERQKAKVQAELDKLAAIEAGTYVAPARKQRERDPNAPVKEKKVKVQVDSIESFVSEHGVTKEEAEFLVPLHFAFKNRRSKVALALFRAPSKILSSTEILDLINSEENETGEPLKANAVVSVINHIAYGMFKKRTNYTICRIDGTNEASYKIVGINSVVEAIEPDATEDAEEAA